MSSFHDQLSRRAVVGALCAAPLWAHAGFRDPLDTPAVMRSSPGNRSLLAVAPAGAALVAVGSRGLIVRSEDAGQHWVQSAVPVQSDLLAVHFPSANLGWAVGHDGVVLHSADGGRTWARQLDGRMAGQRFEAFYSEGNEPAAAQALAQVKKNYGNGPVLPFLDVWFDDERTGYIVGSFGLIAGTQDGGKTWAPWMHRIDNPDQYNLNALRGIGEQLYVAGEHGRVFLLNRARGHFEAQDTGYNGSFFGVVGNADCLLAYGLRGVVYRSDRRTPGRWSPVQMPNEQTITAGLWQPDVGFVLVNAAGQTLLGGQDGLRWQVRMPERPLRVAGATWTEGQSLMLATLDGAHLQKLSKTGESRQAVSR